MSKTTLLLVATASICMSKICIAQFVAPPLTFEDSVISVSKDGSLAELVIVAPSMYTTGAPMPLGKQVDFRVYVTEQAKNGKSVLTPLEIISGSSSFVGASPQPMKVLLRQSMPTLQLAVVAVVDGMASEPTTQNLLIHQRRAPLILVSDN